MDKHWIKDKVAIITGGGSGIGQAIAFEAASHGAQVVIADINETAGEETVSQINNLGRNAVFVRTDVTSTSQITELVRQANILGELKFLANSAGLQTYGTAETTTEELWDSTLDVNLKSMFLV